MDGPKCSLDVNSIGGGNGVGGSCSQVFHPYPVGFRPVLYDLWQPIYVGGSLLLVSAEAYPD